MDNVSKFIFQKYIFHTKYKASFRINYWRVRRFFARLFICSFIGHNEDMVSRPLREDNGDMFLIISCSKCQKTKKQNLI